ncbi:MAG: YceI family protein [Gemmatimonadaceae bacterium]
MSDGDWLMASGSVRETHAAGAGRVVSLTPTNTRVAFEVRWFGILNVRGRFDELDGHVHFVPVDPVPVDPVPVDFAPVDFAPVDGLGTPKSPPAGEPESPAESPAGSPAVESVHVDVSAGSINTGIGLRDHHLRGAPFLDVAHFPTITFRCQPMSAGTRALRRPAHGYHAARDGDGRKPPPADVLHTFPLPGTLTLRGISRDVELDTITHTEQCHVVVAGSLIIRRADYGIGSRGASRMHPGLLAIAPTVRVRVEVTLPIESAR